MTCALGAVASRVMTYAEAISRDVIDAIWACVMTILEITWDLFKAAMECPLWVYVLALGVGLFVHPQAGMFIAGSGVALQMVKNKNRPAQDADRDETQSESDKTGPDQDKKND